MSLSDLAETPQSRDGTTIPGAISLTVPTNLIMLPAAAGLVGLSIGFIRGGSRARLRFLVENAHRKPKTVQGWVRLVPSLFINGNRSLTSIVVYHFSISTRKRETTESFLGRSKRVGNTLSGWEGRRQGLCWWMNLLAGRGNRYLVLLGRFKMLPKVDRKGQR